MEENRYGILNGIYYVYNAATQMVVSCDPEAHTIGGDGIYPDDCTPVDPADALNAFDNVRAWIWQQLG